MKIAKKTLSVVLAMTMVLTCFALGLTAAAGGASLQAAIDATQAGETLVWDGSHIEESVVISKDITIDFGGAKMNSEYGEPAVLITAGNVTLKNGELNSRFGPYSGSQALEDVEAFKAEFIDKSEPAVDVNGGNVVLEDVVCNGAYMRVPSTTTYFVPVGSGLELKNGATLTADSSVFIGRYGINNNVTGAALGGNVTFVDGFAVGYLESVKYRGGVTVPETSEKYDGGELVADFLASMGSDLNQDETDILSEILFDKAYFVAEKASFETETYCKNGTLTVTVDADDSNVIENGFVSYKWVPEAVTVNGITVDAVEEEGGYTATYSGFDTGLYDVEVTKRMQVDVADYYDYIVDIPQYVRDAVNQIPAKFVEFEAELEPMYEDGIGWFYRIFDEVANINRNLYAGESGMAPGYDRVIEAFVAIGGQEMVDHFGYYLLDSQYEPVVVPQNGLITRFNTLLDGLKASSDTTENMAIYVAGNYEELFSIADALMVEINAVYEILTTDPWAPALESELLTEMIPELPEYVEVLEQAGPILDTVNESLAGLESWLGRNIDEYIGQWLTPEGVSIGYGKLMNLEEYYNPTFIDETWLEFISTSNTESVFIENYVFENVTVSAGVVGAGTVSMVDGFTNVTVGSADCEAGQSVTLTAAVVPGNTFVYWTDAVTNRVVSESESFTFRAVSDIMYVAHFVPGIVTKVTYLSMFDCVIDTNEYVGEPTQTEEPDAPYIGGYQFVEWVEISDTGTHIVYKADYVKSSIAFNVSIENDGAGFSGAGEYNMYDIATVSAPSDGFGYWGIVEQGEVVSVASFYSTYSFVVTGDVELSAVYIGSFEQGVAINITQTHEDISLNRITFYAERSVKGYEDVIEVGMILTDDEQILNDGEFDIENDSVIIARSSRTTTAGTFIVNKTGVNPGDTWFARAYVIVNPGEGRPPQVYYSNVAVASMGTFG